jgi:hypothetical protein
MITIIVISAFGGSITKENFEISVGMDPANPNVKGDGDMKVEGQREVSPVSFEEHKIIPDDHDQDKKEMYTEQPQELMAPPVDPTSADHEKKELPKEEQEEHFADYSAYPGTKEKKVTSIEDVLPYNNFDQNLFVFSSK